MITSNDPVLLLVFRSVLTLAILDVCPTSAFRVGKSMFRELDNGDVTGFYDWLRGESGNDIVGVRYWPFPPEEIGKLLVSLGDLDYVTILGNGSGMVVRFRNETPFDEEHSVDQAFGSNRVYVSEASEVAISFGTFSLSPSERVALREIPGERVILETGNQSS